MNSVLLSREDRSQVRVSSDMLLDVIEINHQKWFGIRGLARYLNVARQSIVSYTDSISDSDKLRVSWEHRGTGTIYLTAAGMRQLLLKVTGPLTSREGIEILVAISKIDCLPSSDILTTPPPTDITSNYDLLQRHYDKIYWLQTLKDKLQHQLDITSKDIKFCNTLGSSVLQQSLTSTMSNTQTTMRQVVVELAADYPEIPEMFKDSYTILEVSQLLHIWTQWGTPGVAYTLRVSKGISIKPLSIGKLILYSKDNLQSLYSHMNSMNNDSKNGYMSLALSDDTCPNNTIKAYRYVGVINANS